MGAVADVLSIRDFVPETNGFSSNRGNDALSIRVLYQKLMDFL